MTPTDLDIIGVHEMHQGRGVASKLINQVIETADRGSLEIFLHGTEVAQAFYQQVRKISKLRFDGCLWANIMLRNTDSMS